MNKKYTVKKNSDFHRIYSKGKSAVTPFLVVYIRRNRLNVNRTGYTVSAKLGHAVVRNRVRRRLREVYRLTSPVLSIGYDFIIVARGKAVNARFRDLEKAFFNACQKLELVVR